MRWMFGFGIIFGLAASVFSMIFALAFYPSAEQILPSKTYEFFKDILGPVAAGFGGAIAGAVMGAIANARMQEKFEHNKAAIAQITSYNMGLIILTSMYRELATLKKDLVIPVKDEPLRFILMPITHEINISSDRATDAMRILISTLGLAELLSDLMLAEQSYVAAMGSLIERNRMVLEYREKFDNAMSKKPGRQKAGLKELVEIHGHTSILRLYNYSEATISGLDRSLVRLHDVMVRLDAELAPLVKYKGHILLGLKNSGTYLIPAPSPRYASAEELSVAIIEAISDTKK
ncbi:hypothetical protein VRB78_16350 [Pseudomonas trivialis]|uniref:hypothetical protein n=1 Tax=Pseudomonas trivialis TaxID=200450 RepID=UPI0030D569B5